MYLRSLKLRNLKLLREADISFLRDGEARPWTVFVGENGLCKTALLQAIALAASGPILASELADASSFPDRRHPKENVEIDAEFGFGVQGHASRKYPEFKGKLATPPLLQSSVTIEPGWRDIGCWSKYHIPGRKLREPKLFEDPLFLARRHQLPAWFVAGYGTIRSLPQPRTSRDESLTDPLKSRLENLFDRGNLIATAFADLFDAPKARSFTRALRQVLIQGRLLPRITELELSGHGGVKSAQDLLEAHRFKFDLGRGSVKIPATWLSRGYQGTIAWVADLVGHLLLEAKGALEPEQMEGLVLIDELDLHLHPKWQATLIPALKKTFPRLQFIATTHSAMLLPGLAQDEILLLRQNDEGDVFVEPSSEAPSLMTGSEIFDAFFGIHRLYPNELGEALRRYGYLASNSYRSAAEERELRGLLTQLKKNGIEPGWTPVSRQLQRGQLRPKQRAAGRTARKRQR
jgi:hypothetical protein